jgi:hypothetical protein
VTTRRKKIALRAYDYLTGQNLVVARLRARGEDGKMDRHEMDMVGVAVEIAADKAVSSEVAEAMMVEVAEQIIRERNRTLFMAFDERDNMGDETVSPESVERVA